MSRADIDPLVYEQAAIDWLTQHAGMSMAYALDHWELVDLVWATADDDDYFWSDRYRFRVLNPDRFGVARDFLDTDFEAHEVEPWDIQQPDVEPPPIELMSAAQIGEPPVQMPWQKLAALAAGAAIVWGGAFVLVALAAGWV